MKTVYTKIPCYSGDVSGAASALYELGGMVVIHDPSGCNSTYNTHDEIRWYDQESLIFISGLNDMDAIVGNDEKFVADVVDAARRLHPRFVALCNSPIPYITGTDFEALAAMIEDQLDIPVFYIQTNGLHDYVCGASGAFAAVAAQNTLQRQKTKPHSVNILGLTPLDFDAPGSAAALTKKLEASGWQVVSNWALDCNPDAIFQAGSAAVNLVVSSTGWQAAQILKQRFGIPAVAGCPVGGFAPLVTAALKQSEADGRTRIPYADLLETGANSKPAVAVVGEAVGAASLGAALAIDQGKAVQVTVPVESPPALCSDTVLRIEGESAVEARINQADCVVADPLYQALLEKKTAFVPWHHFAFSGRIGYDQAVNLFEDSAYQRIEERTENGSIK
jgi:nitrogenase molybdenum-cofactor synthesis protein NifE